MAIKFSFNVDLDWLLFGSEFESSEKNIFSSDVNEKEASLIKLLRKIRQSDQNEIIDIIKLKISNYGSKCKEKNKVYNDRSFELAQLFLIVSPIQMNLYQQGRQIYIFDLQ